MIERATEGAQIVNGSFRFSAAEGAPAQIANESPDFSKAEMGTFPQKRT